MKRINNLRLCGFLMGLLATSTQAANVQQMPLRHAEEMLKGFTKSNDAFNQTFFEIDVQGQRKTLVIKLEVGEEDKKWDDAAVYAIPEFGNNTLGFVGNLIGNGYDIKTMQINRATKKVAINDLFEKENNAQKLEKTIASFKTKRDLGIPASMSKIKQDIVENLGEWLNAYSEHPNIKNQSIFYLALHQSGPLSQLQLTCQKIVNQSKFAPQSTFANPGQVSSPAQAEALRNLSQATVTKNAWDATHKSLAKSFTIMLGGKAKKIRTFISFISHEEEATKGSLDMFSHSWNANTSGPLAELSKKDSAFSQYHGFVIAQIGSTSSHLYWATPTGISNRVYRFGTNNYDERMLDSLISEVVGLRRPVAFCNAIGYAKLAGVSSENAAVIDLKNVGKFKDKDKDGKNDGAGIVANALSQKLKAKGFAQNAFLWTAPKKSKIQHRWLTTMIHEYSEFSEPDTLAFVVDWGGRSFSVRSVLNKTFDEGQNLVEWWANRLVTELSQGLRQELDTRIAERVSIVKDGKPAPALDKITDENLITRHYRENVGLGIHKEQKLAMEIIIHSLREWLVYAYENNIDGLREKIDNQEKFDLVIRQSGKPRDQYFDFIEVIKSNGRKKIDEEKKG